MPRYSIITPTILRPSLVQTCESVDNQVCTDWEHIVAVDGIEESVPEEIIHDQRKIIYCTTPHKNWGNTCRHDAWKYATGEYVYYLDDDNILADDRVLEDLKIVKDDWAIFPIIKKKWGGMHFFCPPMRGFTDAGSILVKREIGRYPNSPDYDADGQLVEQLRATHPYRALLFRPLMVKEHD